MKQFIDGVPTAFAELGRRANDRCVRFRAQPLPPGCNPAQADIGFQVYPASGSADLLVTQGIEYAGPSADIREWLRSGSKRFSSFDQLEAWVRGPLRDAFAPETPPVPYSAESLTDLDAIRTAAGELSRAIFVDEEDLLRQLTRVVIGQPTALQALASCVARHCARSHPTRPAVVFAVGPSGVGKTRSAEELADAIAAAGDVKEAYGYLRLDMNEYQEAYRISQLLGSPQGYVGHSEGSQLLDALSSNPRTIVLFDEIEKAHPAILRSLMNAMDAGRISAASKVQGQREIDCSRAIFFFTSNLESRAILDELQQRESFGDRSIEDDICRRRLRAAGVAPEIVGRIGRFLVFRDLTPEVRAEIVTHAIAEIGGEYGLTITRVEPQVVIDLLKQSRSEDFGVRPERSLIDDLIGGVFAAAARKGLRGPLAISGPPYVCTTTDAPTLSAVHRSASNAADARK